MNKQKLNQIKNKIKYYSPEIIMCVSAVAAIAIAYYAIKKTNSFEFPELPSSEGGSGSVELLTGEDRLKIVLDEAFELYKVEDDFYFLSPKD